MIDLVKLILVAGDGGRGRVSFRRERRVPKGGPDGGDGGNGGHVIIRGNKGLATLKHFAGRVLYEAQDGTPGDKRKKIGAKGDNLVLEVPLGTSIGVVAENNVAKKRRTFLGMHSLLKRDAAPIEKYHLDKEGAQIPDQYIQNIEVVGTGEVVEPDVQEILRATKGVQPLVVAEITEDEQEIIICQGGFGGRGNERFKSSTNTTPLLAEFGSEGEKRAIVLELKLLADVGLVGFPNAGKSTLLSVVTKARPKIANYPFTTLEPNLGVVSFDGSDSTDVSELVIADIPGLIEGASEGKGLGLEFLRHVENCSVLLFVLALSEDEVFDETKTDAEKAELLFDQFTKLQRELEKHKNILSGKEFLISVNKLDIYPESLVAAISERFAREGSEVILFSAATKVGLQELTSQLREVVALQNSNETDSDSESESKSDLD